MMADHWTFVIAAYGLAAIVLTTYWRRLVRDERALRAPDRARSSRVTGPPGRGERRGVWGAISGPPTS